MDVRLILLFLFNELTDAVKRLRLRLSLYATGSFNKVLSIIIHGLYGNWNFKLQQTPTNSSTFPHMIKFFGCEMEAGKLVLEKEHP
jgi:hypothetical protein